MKPIEEYTFLELCNLRNQIEALPQECDVTIRVSGNVLDAYTYIDTIEEDFFNIPDCKFKDIVGKIFINDSLRKDTVFKVVGYNPSKPIEFFFEKYIRYNDGWGQDDYNYLQDNITENSLYEKYKDCPEVDINLCSERMFLLGKDGSIYVDYSCGGDYYRYIPFDDEITFNLIKFEAKRRREKYDNSERS